jgi:hypothetical protein
MVPLEANASQPAVSRFSLSFPDLSVDELAPVFQQTHAPTGIAKMLGQAANTIVNLPRMRSTGVVEIARLHWHGSEGHFHAEFSGSDGAWLLRNVEYQFAGGVIQGSSKCDPSGCASTGRMIGLKIARALAASRKQRALSPLDQWSGQVSGTLFGQIQVVTPFDKRPISAEGRFLLFNGSLTPETRTSPATGNPSVATVALRAYPSLKFTSLSGNYAASGETFTLHEVRLVTGRRQIHLELNCSLPEVPQALFARASELLNQP